MTTKTDITKLLAKGLTGKEVGKLILEDSWLYDHGREDFLSDRDRQVLKSSLKTQKDIEDYNSYVETYRILDYTLKEAHIKALQAEVRIGAIETLFYLYLLDSTSEMEYLSKPIIMTEKQYQESKINQRERLLHDIYPLYSEVLMWRVEELDPDWWAKWEDIEDGNFLDYITNTAPDLWKQAISQVLELLRSGKLKPVALPKKTSQKLQAIEVKKDQARARIPSNQMSRDEIKELLSKGRRPPRNREAEQEVERLSDEYDKTVRESYRASRSKLSQESQAKIISLLEQLLAGSLSTEEVDQLLGDVLCSGEELYQTGLPEWLKWIDEYKPGLYEDSGGSGVAILVDPYPYQVDERGYFKGYGRQSKLTDISEAIDIAETYQEGQRQLKEELKIVLSFSSVVEAVSETIGIDFAEDTRSWINDLEEKIAGYNRLIERAEDIPTIPEALKAVLRPISLDHFRPSVKTMRYLRDRPAG